MSSASTNLISPSPSAKSLGCDIMTKLIKILYQVPKALEMTQHILLSSGKKNIYTRLFLMLYQIKLNFLYGSTHKHTFYLLFSIYVKDNDISNETYLFIYLVMKLLLLLHVRNVFLSQMLIKSCKNPSSYSPFSRLCAMKWVALTWRPSSCQVQYCRRATFK